LIGGRARPSSSPFPAESILWQSDLPPDRAADRFFLRAGVVHHEGDEVGTDIEPMFATLDNTCVAENFCKWQFKMAQPSTT